MWPYYLEKPGFTFPLTTRILLEIPPPSFSQFFRFTISGLKYSLL